MRTQQKTKVSISPDELLRPNYWLDTTWALSLLTTGAKRASTHSNSAGSLMYVYTPGLGYVRLA